MPPKFGTSGLRGLVTELTDNLISDYTHAFLKICPPKTTVHVGRDLRPSSPQISSTVIRTINALGLTAVDHGALPTPALALAAMSVGQSAIMITGSHIPADRNGLKFYLPTGEITKSDEDTIMASLGTKPNMTAYGELVHEHKTIDAYVKRYVNAFGEKALSGLRIGVYEHSSVARDALVVALLNMGANVVRLARADHFTPVDTEAVDAQTRYLFKNWCVEHALDALVSTDGDADRPMVVDENGTLVTGDILGPIVAQMLDADTICTPVSSNTAVDQIGFNKVVRTKIGSPYVIEAMEANCGRVVGYEANGGFILGFNAQGPSGMLGPLMTRDCLLPIVAPLARAKEKGVSLAQLISMMPQRFTAADRIQGIPSETSQAFIAELTTDQRLRARFFSGQAEEVRIDTTDGLRVSFADKTIIHLRPSGNAPEFRCYAEANTTARAETLVQRSLTMVEDHLREHSSGA
ncbi:MAG: phosphomannomutase [Marivita sp.]